MRILVVGAGIAGLAAGRALTRAGHTVEVVERASGQDRGGAGIYLPGNAIRARDEQNRREPEQVGRAQRVPEVRPPVRRHRGVPGFA